MQRCHPPSPGERRTSTPFQEAGAIGKPCSAIPAEIKDQLYDVLETHNPSRYVTYGRMLCKLKIDAPNAKQMRNHWCDNEGDCDTCLMNKYYGEQDE